MSKLTLGQLGRGVFGLALGGAMLSLVGCSGGGGGSKSSQASIAAATSGSQSGLGSVPLPVGRAMHTASMLPSGDVLVVGGLDPSGVPTDLSVIINANGVANGPRLSSPRTGHSATVLSNGQVLIAGGRADAQGKTILDTTEIFDPMTSTFSTGPKLTAARTDHVAASIGKPGVDQILIAAGAGPGTSGLVPLASAEVIDMTTNKSTALTAKLAEARASASVARLDDGTVLIASGDAANGAAGAELFDPVAGTFTQVNASIKRSGAGVASTGVATAIIGGQSTTGVEQTSDVYDMASKTISQGQSISVARRDARAVKTPSGVVITGGRDASSKPVAAVEVLSGATLTTATLGAAQPLTTGRYGHSATVLQNGQVLVVGGYDASGVPIASIEVVDPTVTTAPATPPPPPSTTTTTPTPRPSVPPSTTSSGSTSGSRSSSSGGGFLSSIMSVLRSLLGGSSSGGSGGSSFLTSLLSSLLGGGSSSSSGAAGSGGSSLISSLLSSLLGGGGSAPGSSGSSSSSGSSGGSFFSSLLSSLLGGGSGGSGGSGSSSSGGSFFSSLLSSLLGGGSSSSPSSGSSGSSSSGGGGFFSSILSFFSSLFGGGSSSSGSSSSSSSSSSGAPTVLSVLPAKAHVGDPVTIVGLNFGSTATVSFNGVSTGPAAVTPNGSAQQVSVTVPQGATTGTLTITTNGQAANGGTFTVY